MLERGPASLLSVGRPRRQFLPYAGSYEDHHTIDLDTELACEGQPGSYTSIKN
jgi:hypothetical protein